VTVVTAEEVAKSWAKNAAVIIEGTAKDNSGVFYEEGGESTGTDGQQCGARRASLEEAWVGGRQWLLYDNGV